MAPDALFRAVFLRYIFAMFEIFKPVRYESLHPKLRIEPANSFGENS